MDARRTDDDDSDDGFADEIFVDGTEGYRDMAGNEITPEYIARVAAEAEAGYDLDQMHIIYRAPTIVVPLSTDLHDRAVAEAARRGCSIEMLAREALEQHLRRTSPEAG